MNKYICDTECTVDLNLSDNKICCYACEQRTICPQVCDSETCCVKRRIEIDRGEY